MIGDITNGADVERHRCDFKDFNVVIIDFIHQKPYQTHIRDFHVCLNPSVEAIVIHSKQ